MVSPHNFYEDTSMGKYFTLVALSLPLFQWRLLHSLHFIQTPVDTELYLPLFLPFSSFYAPHSPYFSVIESVSYIYLQLICIK